MGHSTKEQLTWWFWSTAGIRMYWQLLLTQAHTFLICMVHVKVKIIWIALRRGIGFYTWYLLFIFWAERKCLERKLCSKEQHPPWSYPVVIVRSKEVNLSHICVNKNMYLLIFWAEFIKQWRWWHCLKTKTKRKSEEEEERKKHYWLR